MATETRYADSNTTLSAGCSGVSNAYGAPDGTYTTNGNEATNWSEQFGIGNPTNNLTSGATDHAVTVTLRKNASGGNGDPTCDVLLYDNGSIIRSLSGAPQSVTDSTTSLGPYTFTTAEVSNGSNVQITLTIVGQGGAPAGRRNVQVDGITVDFNTSSGTAFSETPTDSLPLSDTRAYTQEKVTSNSEPLTDAAVLEEGRYPADAVALTDASASELVRTVNPVDGQPLTDAAASDQGLGRTDQAGPSDSAAVKEPSKWTRSVSVRAG